MYQLSPPPPPQKTISYIRCFLVLPNVHVGGTTKTEPPSHCLLPESLHHPATLCVASSASMYGVWNLGPRWPSGTRTKQSEGAQGLKCSACWSWSPRPSPSWARRGRGQLGTCDGNMNRGAMRRPWIGPPHATEICGCAAGTCKPDLSPYLQPYEICVSLCHSSRAGKR